MPTKRGLVLVKKDQIDACVASIETRQLRAESRLEPQAGVRDMWDKAIAAFESQTQMMVQDGVAIIPVRGTISLDDPWAAFFGETTVKAISDNIDLAVADPKVKSILLTVNSPGGYVAGVEALGDKIYAARKKKPIYAFTDSLAASAAYWIGSAAEKLFVASETSEVGSIGVYMVHFDYSGMLSEAGIKVTEVTAGEYKGLGSPYAELSDEDKKLLTADANFVYTRFVEAVARNRGLSTKDVLKSANGLTFFGSDAKAKGLIDGIATQQEVIAMTTAAQQAQSAEAEAAKKKETEEAEKTAQAARLAAAEKEAAEAKAALKVLQDKEAAAQSAATEAEVKTVYKAAFGREATKEEVAHYLALNDDGRKLHKANLEETAKNREELAKKAGLFTEAATEGATAEGTAGGGLLLNAVKALGFDTGK